MLDVMITRKKKGKEIRKEKENVKEKEKKKGNVKRKEKENVIEKKIGKGKGKGIENEKETESGIEKGKGKEKKRNQILLQKSQNQKLDQGIYYSNIFLTC